MIVIKCDRCSKQATPKEAYYSWLNVRSELRSEADPDEWNLCSWRCLEEWAASRQLHRSMG